MMPLDGTFYSFQNSATVQTSEVSSLMGENLWERSAQNKLAAISQLAENWNSYGSKPIYPRVIRKAANLLSDLGKMKISEPQIFPVAGGGLQMEWKNSKRELEIEILPDESIEYLIVDDDGEMYEGRLPQMNLLVEILMLTEWFKTGKNFSKNTPTMYATA